MSGRRTAICPGTFDPIHAGHVDVIERAAGLFDHMIVLVAADSGKSTLFSAEERTELARAALTNPDNVDVGILEGLLVEHARRVGAVAIVKGLRSIADFQREQQMAMMNHHLYPDTDTVLLVTSPHVQYISSSLVREIWALGGDVTGLVPDAVAEALQSRRQHSQHR